MKDKYLSFSRVIGQDVKELIKYFEPREIAREEDTWNINMQVKNFNQEQIQDWYISVFLYILKRFPVIGCAGNTDWWKH